MRRALAACLLLGALLTGCSDDPPAETGPQPLPSYTLEGFDGGPSLDLSTVKGPAVITFWGSWCGPCRDELPILQQFHEQRRDVKVIGIDYLDPRTELADKLVRDSGLSYPLYSDLGGELSGKSPFPVLRGLPYTAFVDADGQMVHGEFVILDSVAQLDALVDEHLGPEAATS